MPKKQRYAVMCKAEVTLEMVVVADSPEDAVRMANEAPRSRWKDIDFSYEEIESVTERRKNGKAFSVEDDGRCVEALDDIPW